MHEYRTNFNLTDGVKDMSAAQEYLDEDDMSVYLLGDFPQLASKKPKIRWILTHPNKGYITLKSEEPIDRETLDEISKWVAGQNADGLGEGFEQQDFAYYATDEPWGNPDDEDYEEEYIECSFDWEKNEYKFEEVEQ